MFAKNERGNRLTYYRIWYRSLLILLLSVASIRRKCLKTSTPNVNLYGHFDLGFDVYKHFLLIGTTDRSKISSDQDRIKFDISLYSLSCKLNYTLDFYDSLNKLLNLSKTWTTYQCNIAYNTAQLMTLLMYEEFALYTLEPLPTQAPDTVVTVSTKCFPVKPLCL